MVTKAYLELTLCWGLRVGAAIVSLFNGFAHWRNACLACAKLPGSIPSTEKNKKE